MATKVSDKLTIERAKALWIQAQRLDEFSPFGDGSAAVKAAVEHLGYVQIDTINVIERSHHHILFSRIPKYHRRDLHAAQTTDKSVFEYWTHALSYVPSRDLPYFMPLMKRYKLSPGPWFASVDRSETERLFRQIRKEGALSICDIDDEVLVDKNHPWASRKPSKKLLQLGFYSGRLTISERIGMLKKYELMDRHFGWTGKPKAKSAAEVVGYALDRALRTQSFVSIESSGHLEKAPFKAATLALVEKRLKRGELIEVSLAGFEKQRHWIKPESLDLAPEISDERVHLLSPFDPLIIQRKRLAAIFGHDHRFEAYIPKEKRVMGYFALPVLVGDRIVAAIDLKTDRSQKKLLIQQWTWLGRKKSARLKSLIESELDRFEKFQLS